MRKFINQRKFPHPLSSVLILFMIFQGCDFVMESDVTALKDEGPQAIMLKGKKVKDYEVWSLDQGTDLSRIHIFNSSLGETDVIDFSGLYAAGEIPLPVTMPHMIEFNSTHEYAAVASPASGNVAIIRTADRKVIEVIATGAGAHMASFTPDDQSIWVANIGTVTFTEITVDLATESFAIGRELNLLTDPEWIDKFTGVQGGGGGALGMNVSAPVCHGYTANGAFAYVTLGPGAGGLVVVDILSGEPKIVKAFSREEVKANCGLALSRDGSKMYANWGDPGDPNIPVAESGEWYVFDTSNHTLMKSSSDTRGVDAHGARISPRGPWLWQVNRGSDNGIIINTQTDKIVHYLDDVGSSPDILDFSPDGKYAFITLRGPNPRSGAAHVATGETPGFSVINTATRRKIAVIQPAPLEDRQASDFHGIKVRHIF
ncbi:YncE family protein [Negadavirga shengliensis]|uniref:YncE family protein n=1 Tax=Negadavirga shengliensis TaxID=1389218 RepID=A0ABV9TA34_9BACT